MSLQEIACTCLDFLMKRTYDTPCKLKSKVLHTPDSFHRIARHLNIKERLGMVKKRDRKESSTEDRKKDRRGGNKIKKKIIKGAGVAAATTVVTKGVKSRLKRD